MNTSVFVYGTLRAGESRNSVLELDKRLCKTAFVRGFTLLDLGSFPGVLRGKGQVRGEVYKVDNRTLKVLDHIEGYQVKHPKDSLYIREVVPIFDAEGNPIGEAWIYIFNRSRHSSYPIIESGDWFEHLGFYSKELSE